MIDGPEPRQFACIAGGLHDLRTTAAKMVPRLLTMLTAVMAIGGPSPADHAGDGKLDGLLLARAHAPAGVSRVIVRAADGRLPIQRILDVGGTPGPLLLSLGAQVATVPDRSLHDLASSASVAAVGFDRPVMGALAAGAATIGARWVNDRLGVDGRGVGVALIDSGVSAWHDDLEGGRVAHFVDLVNGRVSAYDDYGHGTHVAGAIAGSGRDSDGARRGVAPGARLVVLKALDGAGGGYTSTVIAAIEYAIAHREKYGIRVINLSVSAGVYESYTTDPLTLAARRAVDAGIVVVAAAGNLGRNALGELQRGGITAPGNAPWVLTVGASDDRGTVDRGDDRVAPFSSRGPSAIDGAAKPDLVAPGVAIESLAEPSSVLFGAHPRARVRGTVSTVSPPYLSLTGTSMAAPLVAATAALMVQANPSLTPNAVKAILQFTAEQHPRYDAAAQGAGFLNARGAVELARTFGAPAQRAAALDPVGWSRRIIWGDRVMTGGVPLAGANAWRPGVVWGSAATPGGEPIVLGALCAAGQECTGGPWMPAASTTPVSDDADASQPPAAPTAWMPGFLDEHLVTAGHIAGVRGSRR